MDGEATEKRFAALQREMKVQRSEFEASVAMEKAALAEQREAAMRHARELAEAIRSSNADREARVGAAHPAPTAPGGPPVHSVHPFHIAAHRACCRR